MAGIQAAGVGSGLDIASLVTQLVAAERAPLDARITRRETAATLQISALAGLKSGIGTLRDALVGLDTDAALNLRTATSSAKEVFTASADADVLPGAYDVEVVRLATAHRLASTPFVDGRNAVVGTGTLTVAYGTTSFTVEVDGTENTLAGVRDAINSASGNAGVTASIVNEVGGSRLVLTARATGVDNSITITQAGGDGGLASLVYDPGAPAANTLASTAATDALVRVNGYDYESASNVVTGAVEGLTLNLLQADEGTTHTVTVANDTVQTAVKIKKFVQDYNALAKVFSSLQAYDPATGKAGALLGDAFARGLESQLRRDLSDTVAGATGVYGSLAAIGIKTDSRGQLVVNETRLNAALAADFQGVASMFTASDGVAVRMKTRLDAALEADAQLAVRNEALTREVKRLTKEKDAVDMRMETVEARYRAQFTMLDTLLTQMQTTSSFLSQQLASVSRSS